ncbi:MAG: hypothetical protein RMK74_03495 [Myxococcales bacterium]|nr:hypothetical protein [Myxococcales bacterium]
MLGVEREAQSEAELESARAPEIETKPDPGNEAAVGGDPCAAMAAVDATAAAGARRTGSLLHRRSTKPISDVRSDGRAWSAT